MHSQALKTILGILAFLILAAVGYSIYVTVKSGALKEGIVTCLEDNSCFWTAHIHAFVSIEACGEKLSLPQEVGSLDIGHTHEERNVLHWHDRLLYDAAERKIVDTAPLALKSAFQNIDVVFGEKQILNFKNGDMCPQGKSGAWKMFVNGTQSTEFENYVWHDRDVLYFVFDERPAADVELWLQSNPIVFPPLGRG